MRLNNLRKHRHAVERVFRILAHLADPQIDRSPGFPLRLGAENLLRAFVGERVAVQTDAHVGFEDDARGFGEGAHVGDPVVAFPLGARGRGGIVLDHVALASPALRGAVG